MKSSFVVCIDQSGDEGFVFRADGAGSSRWLVLSAAVIRHGNDLQMVSCLNAVRELLQKPPKTLLHFVELKHEQRVPCVRRVPGHTWGHLAVWDESSGSLAIADAILGSAVPLADGAPAFPPTYRHVAPYLATIARVRELAPVRLLTAHYGVFEGAAVTAFLDESERFVLELDKQVRASLRRAGEAGTTLVRLLDDLTGRIGAWPSEGVASAFAFPVAGHVEWLAERGDAVVDLATTPPTFRARP